MKQRIPVSLPSLPKDIQEQIPMSIRSISDNFFLDELPPKIQELIREYLKKEVQATR